MNARSTVIGAAAVALVAVALQPAAAQAAPLLPCGSQHTLAATHQASADFHDHNGDLFECSAHSDDASGDFDNQRLPLARGTTYPLYSFRGSNETGVVRVNPDRNRFVAYLLTQEDDRDWNGCFGRCRVALRYDANDLFYVNDGAGSRKVAERRFERALGGDDYLSMRYVRGSARRSIFTIEQA
jgi:hypothetical protein